MFKKLFFFICLLVLLPLSFAVPHARFGGFADFENRVSFSNNNLLVVDDIIYSIGYYSVNNLWVPFSFGDDVWLYDSAFVSLPDVFNVPGEHYIIVYSCSDSDGWICHSSQSESGFWQLFVIVNNEVLHAVNINGPAFTSSEGISFAADDGSFIVSAFGFDSSSDNIFNSVDDILFQTQRIGRVGTSPSSPLELSFPVVNGEYVVDLYFSEIYYGSSRYELAGDRLADISIEGVIIESNFDIGPYSNEGVVKSYDVEVVDGSVSILLDFSSRSDPALAAVVIRDPSMPAVSCFDDVQNQGEVGVDCGGPCSSCLECVIVNDCFTSTCQIPSACNNGKCIFSSPLPSMISDDCCPIGASEITDIDCIGNIFHVGSGYEFETVEEGRDAVRVLTSNGVDVPPGGVEVIVHEGLYEFTTNGLVFDNRDSGTENRLIVWRVADGEEVHLTGGTSINSDWFTLSSSDITNRIVDLEGVVYELDLSAHGINNFGTYQYRGYQGSELGTLELSYDDNIMTLARWPNKGETVESGLDVFFLSSDVSPDLTGRFIAAGTEPVADNGGSSRVTQGMMNYVLDHEVNGQSWYLYNCNWDNGYTRWFITAVNPNEVERCWPEDITSFAGGEDMVLTGWGDGASGEGAVLSSPSFDSPKDGFVKVSDAILTTTLSGNVNPAVSGIYFVEGVYNNFDYYMREGLVDGEQYYLYASTTSEEWELLHEYNEWVLSTELGADPSSLTTSAWKQPADNNCWNCFGSLSEMYNGASGIPIFDSYSRLQLPGTRFENWVQATDVWLQGLFGNYWSDDLVQGEIYFGGKYPGTVMPLHDFSYGVNYGQPFFVLNLLEEMNIPGEYYIEREGVDVGTLYFIPPNNNLEEEMFISLLEEPILTFEGANYIAFSGFTFSMSRDDLIFIDDASSHITIENSILKNTGMNGIEMYGHHNGISQSIIRSTGANGAFVFGGDRRTLERADNFVKYNEISDFGRCDRMYNTAVKLRGVGHIVSHNHMFDGPHTAVLYKGNEHTITYNLIEDVVKESNDAGAIYTGRDWGYRGTNISFNIIKDINSIFGGAHGVYLDDVASGMYVFGNIFYNISSHAILNGGGRDNYFVNNVFDEVGSAVMSDRRAIRNNRDVWGYLERPDSWNLLGRLQFDYDNYYVLIGDDGSAALNFQQGAWLEHYPELSSMPTTFDEVEDSHWEEPESYFDNNIMGVILNMAFVEGSWGGNDAFDYFSSVINNNEFGSSIFVNPQAGDFDVIPAAITSVPGFRTIPIDEIGPGN